MHPFDPWRSQRFVVATHKPTWGEDRVMYFNAQGQLRLLPAEWTNIDPPAILFVVGPAIPSVDLCSAAMNAQQVIEHRDQSSHLNGVSRSRP